MQLIFGSFPNLGVLISSNLGGWCLVLALIRKYALEDQVGLFNKLLEEKGDVLFFSLTSSALSHLYL